MSENEYVQEYLQYGGQAIIEGVMMRSPNYFSVSCRAPNGEIVTKTEKITKSWIGRQKITKMPFFRGSLAIFDSVALGSKAMRFASNVQIDPQYAEGASAETEANSTVAEDNKGVQNAAIGSSMFIGLIIGVFVFLVLPNIVAERLGPKSPSAWIEKNLITEVCKIAFFLGYVSLIRMIPEIKRVFHFHGAEHKAINTLEALQPLDIEHCKQQTRLHPRCGTSFAVIVLIISLLLMTFVPRYPIPNLPVVLNVFIRVLVELAFLPIISGFSYELIRFAGKFRNQKIVMALFTPGLMTQYITTCEPDDAQIEVALEALKSVVAAEKNGLPETVTALG